MAKRKSAPPPPAISVSTRRTYKHLADVKIEEPSLSRLPHPGGTSRQPGAEKAARKAAHTQRLLAPRRMKTSAAGLKELSELLGLVRPKNGVTFLFSQHLDAKLERKLRKLLTGMRHKPVVVNEPGASAELRKIAKELRDRTTQLNQAHDDITGILGNIQIPIIIVGNDLHIRCASDAAKVLLSKRSSDSERKITDTMLAIQVPDLKDRILNVVDLMRATEHEFQDDEGCWKLLRIQPMRKSDKTIDGALVMIVDIDVQRNIEARLREEENRRRRLFETVHGIVVIIDSNQQVGLINRKGCELLGCDEHDIVGRNWFDTFIPEARRAEARGMFAQMMAHEIETDASRVIPVLATGGDEKILLWHSAVLTDETGTPVAVFSSGQEVSALKNAERALVETDERLRIIMETARCDEAAIIDLSGNVLSWMAGTDRGKKARGKEVIGKHFSSLFSAEDFVSGRPMRMLAEAESNGRCEGEGWYLDKDGAQHRAKTFLIPLRATDGTLRGFSSIVQYINE